MYRPCLHCEGKRYDKDYCPQICKYGELKVEIEELEQQLANSVLLPCQVGDDVWIIHNNKVCLGYVRYLKIVNYLEEIKLLVGISNRDYYKNNCNYFVVDNLNKTWFLTREQAEHRLKELLEDL